MLDREGSSVGRDAESQLEGARHTQEGRERGRNVNATASTSNVEAPTNPVAEPMRPEDEDSTTGRSKFSHRYTHDTLTSPP